MKKLILAALMFVGIISASYVATSAADVNIAGCCSNCPTPSCCETGCK